MMRNKAINVFLWMLIFLLPGLAHAGDRKSERLKPRWISVTPQPKNATYLYKVTYVDNASSLEGARAASMRELMKSVEHEENVSVIEDYDYTSEQQGRQGVATSETSRDIYTMKIQSDGHVTNLNYIKWDEYWEVVYEWGQTVFKLYTLYAVAHKGLVPHFDDVTFTNKYGIRGGLYSLIPGMGQLYKGSTVKGLSILGGAALLAGGVVFTENQRASYQKKMYEDPAHIKEYNTNMDNWETARNVCIGAAAALYIYNLVDALVSDGRKRAVVKRKQYFSMQPVLNKECNGFALSFNF